MKKGLITRQEKEFLQLESNARLILTGSGGFQEEACILKIPRVTMRKSTERPETVEQKANIVAGTEAEKILESAKIITKNDRNWGNSFGDGKSAERILNKLIKIFVKN